MIFVSDFFLCPLLHTQIRGPEEEEMGGWGGRNRIPRMVSVGGLVCRPPGLYERSAENAGPSCFSLCFSAGRQGYTFHKAKPKVTCGKMARNFQGLVDFRKLTSTLCGSVRVPWGRLCQKDVSEEDVSSKTNHTKSDIPCSLFSFSQGSHVRMWELDYKEHWELKNWCLWTVVLEKTLDSPLDCKEIKPVNPGGNQPWLFVGQTDAEAPILWPLDAKSQLTGKDPDAGKDWRQKGAREERWLDGITSLMDVSLRKLRETVKDRESLACCSPWGHEELDTT